MRKRPSSDYSVFPLSGEKCKCSGDYRMIRDGLAPVLMCDKCGVAATPEVAHKKDVVKKAKENREKNIKIQKDKSKPKKTTLVSPAEG